MPGREIPQSDVIVRWKYYANDPTGRLGSRRTPDFLRLWVTKTDNEEVTSRVFDLGTVSSRDNEYTVDGIIIVIPARIIAHNTQRESECLRLVNPLDIVESTIHRHDEEKERGRCRLQFRWSRFKRLEPSRGVFDPPERRCLHMSERRKINSADVMSRRPLPATISWEASPFASRVFYSRDVPQNKRKDANLFFTRYISREMSQSRLIPSHHTCLIDFLIYLSQCEIKRCFRECDIRK